MRRADMTIPGTRVEDTLAQAAQAPSRSLGPGHTATGDVHHLISDERDEKAHLVACDGI